MVVQTFAFIVGLFFVLARFRFFYDPSKSPSLRWFNRLRYQSLYNKIHSCGWTHRTALWTWYTAVVEVLGGLSLMLNIGRSISGPLLLGLLLVASKCTYRTKCLEQCPVDKIDWLCAYLWRVEGLYIAMLAVVVVEDWGYILIPSANF